MKDLKWRGGLAAFLILSCLGILCIYRSALWNETILAPLDIGPTLFSKYKWMQPEAGEIPANHYLVDIFDYELPRQHLAHQSIHGGEFPWWNPYTHGGIPFAAESHISITDPVRWVFYKLLPFEAAYNWTRVIHSFLSGLAMWLLLRGLKFSLFATIFGSITYQFATAHALFIFPPAVRASFLYYPLLWLAWHTWMENSSLAKFILAALAGSGILLAGNQQCYAYLPFFCASFCAGYSGLDIQKWRRTVSMAAGTMLFAALLAMPVVLPQIEIYLLSSREVSASYDAKRWLAGLVSLSGIFPWSLGTFRTLDLSKFVDTMGGLGFAVFIGSAGAILACCGATGYLKGTVVRPEMRTSCWLIFSYFVAICSTPLLGILYARASDLAIFGLIVFLAAGIDYLQDKSREGTLQRVALGMMALVTVLVAGMHLAAMIVFPKVKPKVLEVVLARDQSGSGAFPAAPALRTEQVNNLPREITFQNPEVLFAFLSVVAISLIWRAKGKPLAFAWVLLLILNTVPMILFSQRFMPRHPVTQFKKLLQGGPEQLFVKEVVGRDLRFYEHVPSRFDLIYPGVTAMYQRVHTLNGYATFEFRQPGQKPLEKTANLTYTNNTPGLNKTGIFATNTLESMRFKWSDPAMEREIRIVSESLNEIKLHVGGGKPGELIRTDTCYPGWQVTLPRQSTWRKTEAGLMAFDIPADEIDLKLTYRPRFHSTSKAVSLSASGLSILMLLGACLRRKDPKA